VLLPPAARDRAPGRPGDLAFSRWLGSAAPWKLLVVVALVAAWPFAVAADSRGYTMAQAFDALWRWLPFLVTKGFLMNVLISFLTMAVGTLGGVVLGLGFGVALSVAIPDDAIDRVSVPAGQMVGLVVVAVAFGLIAAVFPSYRAGRMNVLDAIAAD